MGQKGVGECLRRLACEAADRYKRRRLIGGPAEHSNFDRNGLDPTAQQGDCERHVSVEVIVHIEVAVGLAWIENRHLDHALYDKAIGASLRNQIRFAAASPARLTASGAALERTCISEVTLG
jgi:hypothetical protein